MHYVIDTQLFLWWLSDDSRLKKKPREIISNSENQLFLSAASIWEISIKSSIGKLPYIKNISTIAEEEGFTLLPIHAVEAEKVTELPHHHKDPFDRLLVAQAKCSRIPLLTADEQLKKYGKHVLVVNTRGQ